MFARIYSLIYRYEFNIYYSLEVASQTLYNEAKEAVILEVMQKMIQKYFIRWSQYGLLLNLGAKNVSLIFFYNLAMQ